MMMKLFTSPLSTSVMPLLALCCIILLQQVQHSLSQTISITSTASSVSPGVAQDKKELLPLARISSNANMLGLGYCNVIFKNLAMRSGVKYTVYIYVNHFPVLFYKKGPSGVVYMAGKLEYGQEATLFATPNTGGHPALYYAYAFPANTSPKAPWDQGFKAARAYEWTSNGNYRVISNPFGTVKEVARVGFRALPVNRNGNTKITLSIN